MWLLFCYFYSGHSCSGDMNAANHTDCLLYTSDAADEL